MSVELRLLITRGVDWLAHEQLHAPSNAEMFNELEQYAKEKGYTIPKDGLHCYCARNKNEETAYGTVKEDCYGNIISGLSPKELSDIMEKHSDGNWYYSSIIAYLKLLPERNIIYLFFH